MPTWRSLHKNPIVQGLENFHVGEQGWWTLPELALCISSSGQSSVCSITHHLCQCKAVFLSVLRAVLASNWIQNGGGGGHGNLWLATKSTEIVGKLRTYHLEMASEVGGQSRGTGPLTYGFCATPVRVRIELNCKIPSWYHGELLGTGAREGHTTHLVSEVLWVW